MDQKECPRTAREIAKELAKTMRCNCDLDRWQPTATTGHSQVCRIHRTAIAKYIAGDPA